MATPRQIAANRRNASRSTGPRTPQGKIRSAQNASSHGCRAATLILATLGETKAEYQTHLQSQIDSYKPKDDHQRALVETIAEAKWRIFRANRLDQLSYAEPDIFKQVRLSSTAFTAEYRSFNIALKAEIALYCPQKQKITNEPNSQQPVIE